MSQVDTREKSIQVEGTAKAKALGRICLECSQNSREVGMPAVEGGREGRRRGMRWSWDARQRALSGTVGAPCLPAPRWACPHLHAFAQPAPFTWESAPFRSLSWPGWLLALQASSSEVVRSLESQLLSLLRSYHTLKVAQY